MNTQQLKAQLREILSLHAYDIGDLSDRIDALFADFEAQSTGIRQLKKAMTDLIDQAEAICTPTFDKSDLDTPSAIEGFRQGVECAIKMLDLLEAPQPLAVVVPKIEWGETHGEVLRSKCGGYVIEDMNGRFYAFEASSVTPFSPSFEEIDPAKAACQAHKEAAITKALEGCKVVVQKDAGVLVDALKRIVEMDEARSTEFLEHEIYGDSEFRSLAASFAKSAVEEWEAGK